MKFLDKLTKMVDTVVDTLEDTANKANKVYQEKGIAAVVEKGINKVNENVDQLIKNAQNYYDKNVVKPAEEMNKKDDELKTAQSTKTSSEKSSPETSTTGTKKTTIVPTKKTLLIDQLLDGEVISLDCTPLEIVLKNLNAVHDKRLPGKWTMENGSSIQVVHNKWFCFNKSIGQQQGAVNLVKFALTKEALVSVDDKEANKHLTNDALVLLDKYQKDPSYHETLSGWMNNEKSFAEKKAKVAKPTQRKAKA